MTSRMSTASSSSSSSSASSSAHPYYSRHTSPQPPPPPPSPHPQSLIRTALSIAAVLVCLALALLLLFESVGLGSHTNSSSNNKKGSYSTSVNSNSRNRHHGHLYKASSSSLLSHGAGVGTSETGTGIDGAADSVQLQLYVVPGGGGSGTLPPWTKARLDTALDHYHRADAASESGTRIEFLLLSAGSMNSPSAFTNTNTNTNANRNPSVTSTGSIKFESTYMLEYLLQHGVEEKYLHGDFMSWDTVGNALVLRLFVEGCIGLGSSTTAGAGLSVKVFISDFHAKRVEAAFRWVLSLEPSLLAGPGSSNLQPERPAVDFEIVKVESKDSWFNAGSGKDGLKERNAHEYKGTKQIQEQAKQIKTWPAFLRFMLMGEHAGIRKYMLGSYRASNGTGW